MEFLQTIPILRIFDVAKAKNFYLVSEHHGDACPGAAVFLRVRGPEAWHAELRAKDYRYQRPGIETTPWHTWLMELTDPFGNRLRFNEDLP